MNRHPTPAERDERVILPLDPEEALRGLLAVKPDDDDAREREETEREGRTYEAGDEEATERAYENLPKTLRN